MKQTIIDFTNLIESVRKDGRRHDYKIDYIEVYEDFLYYKRRYINHAYHKAVEYYLFPNENIGIYKFEQYENIKMDLSDVFRYYVDMVSVQKNDSFWDIKDLYIDFIIKRDNNYYVVDIDEFNDAVSSKELDCDDVSNSLNGLNCILKGYYMNFDIEAYINRLLEEYRSEGNLILVKEDF